MRRIIRVEGICFSLTIEKGAILINELLHCFLKLFQFASPSLANIQFLLSDFELSRFKCSLNIFLTALSVCTFLNLLNPLPQAMSDMIPKHQNPSSPVLDAIGQFEQRVARLGVLQLLDIIELTFRAECWKLHLWVRLEDFNVGFLNEFYYFLSIEVRVF